jgi:uncharacterized protein YjbI with pentapeptide repeats
MAPDHSASSRWTGPDGNELQDAVFARLITGRSLRDLGLAAVNGRLDLRHIVAPTPRRLQRFEWKEWFVEELGDLLIFRNVRLQGLDFSGAALTSLRFHGCTITGCSFSGARCDDWRLWDTEINDCDFARASLRNAAVGTWHDGRRNSWRHVDFSRADFRIGVSKQASYQDCNFSKAKLTKVQFSQCSFVRCHFDGDVRGVLFDGRPLDDSPAPPPMAGVDFTRANFHEVEFKGLALADVQLPDDSAVRLIPNFPSVLSEALLAIEADDSASARGLRAVLENHRRMTRTENEDYVFNRNDWQSWGGVEEAEFVANVLERAEQSAATKPVARHKTSRWRRGRER